MPDLALPKSIGSGGQNGGNSEGKSSVGEEGKSPARAAVTGIPATALDAYKKAAQAVADSRPGCHLPWELVAGIGRVESVHASGHGLRADGTTATPIRGPRLDGRGFALIRDTDGGRWDDDTEFDRAVGPTQFIPSTWQTWGADGNGDGIKDPNNFYDAALGTARYLCAGDRDLRRGADLDRAILSYNNSRAYVNAVLEWMRTYQGNPVTEVADTTSATPHQPDPDANPPHPPATSPSHQNHRASVGTAGHSGAATTPTRPLRPADQPAAKPTPTGTPRPEHKPAPETKPKPKPETTSRPRTATALERIGPASPETTAGQTLDGQLRVRTVDVHGAPVPLARVTYEIQGVTTARFPDGARRVTGISDPRGIVTVPGLHVGDIPGAFNVRATLGSDPAAHPVTFTVAVRPIPADALTLLTERPLEAVAGSRLTDGVQVRATHRGRPVAGTQITATLIGPTEQPAENHRGPHFEDERGEPVHTIRLPATNRAGVTTLPLLQAGEHPGVYILRLTTHDGISADSTLTVTAPKSKN
ncbi:lytic transglycosylase domain-containing protein [Streptomyces sp. NBRC 110611]|uniref:lytic transglycosylase domain-containing protein n=1 Tax=Streptomyces sp. NBRC 110611 TaxID=1621259 RepID=UPI0015EE41BF|nr:lytic transglycosylase domain-containing protein [Streptomyces sp. NBRC 110611]